MLNGTTLNVDIDTLVPDDYFIANERTLIRLMSDTELEQYRQLDFADKKYAMFINFAPPQLSNSINAVALLGLIITRFAFGNTTRLAAEDNSSYADIVRSGHNGYKIGGILLAGITASGLHELGKTFDAFGDLKFVLEMKAENVAPDDIKKALLLIRAARDGAVTQVFASAAPTANDITAAE
jgi:hypothetical protein